MRILGEAIHILATLQWRALFDILLSSAIIYYVIKLLRGTRAVQLAWGLVVLSLAARLADVVQFRTLGLLLGAVTSPGAAVAIVILFLPELRHALEEVGRGRFLAVRGLLRREDVGEVVDDLVDTATQLSQNRIGALMVLERDDGLEDITSTGTPINATISPRLLISIFYPGTPLHDGAVVIRGNEVTAAACVLPLSDNTRISSSLHTRHRAALGLAERTDAAVLVVSEETGNISLAYDGRLLTALRPEVVRDKLLGLLQRDEGSLRARHKGEPAEQAKGKTATSFWRAGWAANGELRPTRLWQWGWRACLGAPRALLALGRRVAGVGEQVQGESQD
ncbi:MAG: TIGR00159 family protein [Armatimonadetes bacterium]|jgi:diadenylate cyclase|nr:TIGR00159 family protein [Armatimonadota bacterium]